MAMSRKSDARFGLAEYLTQLQAELSRVCARAEVDDLKFRVDGVTVEVDVLCTPIESADSPTAATREFWLLGSAAQAGAGSAHRDVQNVVNVVIR